MAPMQIMNRVGMNSSNIVNNVGIFIDIVAMHNILVIILGWTMIHVNSAKNITPPVFLNASMNVWLVKKYYYYLGGLTKYYWLSKGGTNPHGWIMLCTIKTYY